MRAFPQACRPHPSFHPKMAPLNHQRWSGWRGGHRRTSGSNRHHDRLRGRWQGERPLMMDGTPGCRSVADRRGQGQSWHCEQGPVPVSRNFRWLCLPCHRCFGGCSVKLAPDSGSPVATRVFRGDTVVGLSILAVIGTVDGWRGMWRYRQV